MLASPRHHRSAAVPRRAPHRARWHGQGYASLFGEIDQARDMVMAGAFARR